MKKAKKPAEKSKELTEKLMKHQKSFTLIELLVVLAIIGLFASIVFINIQGARERARISMGLQFSQSVYNALGAYAVGVWRFEENGLDTCSGTIPYNDICDASGENNHGANYGATWTSEGDTPSRQGYALSFNSAESDYIQVLSSNSLNISGNITITAWIYNKAKGEYVTIIEKSGPEGRGSADYGLWVGTDGEIWIYWHGFFVTHTSSLIVPLKSWTHIAVTYDGSYVNFYMNGVQDEPQRETTPISDSGYNYNLYIGKDPWAGQPNYDFFDGNIDELAIYAQSLTTAQIQKLYVEGLERHKNLVQN